MSDFRCEFCHKEQDTLYEGWFYTKAKHDPFAQGTASAGLMQKRRACKECTELAILNKMTQATEIPDDGSLLSEDSPYDETL